MFLARTGTSKEKIRKYIENHFYSLEKTVAEIRPTYRFDVTCQGSVPQAIEAFLESNDFGDAIRTAISIGGDSDTVAAITGGIAEAYYGTPDTLRNTAMQYLTDEIKEVVFSFERTFC